MTISKRCDVSSCFLFVVVAVVFVRARQGTSVCVCVGVCVCVCISKPVVCFCFEDGITNVYVSTVQNRKIFGKIQGGGRKFLRHFKCHFGSQVTFRSIRRLISNE